MKRLKENLEKIEALLSLYDEIVLHESESGAELHSTALKSMYVKRDILKLIIDTNDLIKILNETKYV